LPFHFEIKTHPISKAGEQELASHVDGITVREGAYVGSVHMILELMKSIRQTSRLKSKMSIR
jgi:hypothetical protein